MSCYDEREIEDLRARFRPPADPLARAKFDEGCFLWYFAQAFLKADDRNVQVLAPAAQFLIVRYEL